MDKIDIWRAAQQLVKMFEAEAPLIAARRADKATDQGDPEGEYVWKQIMRAVEELQRKTRDISAPLN